MKNNLMSFQQWLDELIAVTKEKTKLEKVSVNTEEARKWFDDGFTPYQTFRETWGMENDTE